MKQLSCLCRVLAQSLMAFLWNTWGGSVIGVPSLYLPSHSATWTKVTSNLHVTLMEYDGRSVRHRDEPLNNKHTQHIFAPGRKVSIAKTQTCTLLNKKCRKVTVEHSCFDKDSQILKALSGHPAKELPGDPLPVGAHNVLTSNKGWVAWCKGTVMS